MGPIARAKLGRTAAETNTRLSGIEARLATVERAIAELLGHVRPGALLAQHELGAGGRPCPGPSATPTEAGGPRRGAAPPLLERDAPERIVSFSRSRRFLVRVTRPEAAMDDDDAVEAVGVLVVCGA